MFSHFNWYMFIRQWECTWKFCLVIFRCHENVSRTSQLQIPQLRSHNKTLTFPQHAYNLHVHVHPDCISFNHRHTCKTERVYYFVQSFSYNYAIVFHSGIEWKMCSRKLNGLCSLVDLCMLILYHFAYHTSFPQITVKWCLYEIKANYE